MTAQDDPNWGWEFRLEDFVFARLNEDQATAEKLPGGVDRSNALNRVAGGRYILAEHSIYVTREGENHARCYTCPPTHGVPCVTLIALARSWADHPDVPFDLGEPNWLIAPVIASGTFRRLNCPGTVQDTPQMEVSA